MVGRIVKRGSTSSAWPSIGARPAVRRIYEPLTAGRNHVRAFLALRAPREIQAPVSLICDRQADLALSAAVLVSDYYPSTELRGYLLRAYSRRIYNNRAMELPRKRAIPFVAHDHAVTTPRRVICTTRRESVVYRPYNRSRGDDLTVNCPPLLFYGPSARHASSSS